MITNVPILVPLGFFVDPLLVWFVLFYFRSWQTQFQTKRIEMKKTKQFNRMSIYRQCARAQNESENAISRKLDEDNNENIKNHENNEKLIVGKFPFQYKQNNMLCTQRTHKTYHVRRTIKNVLSKIPCALCSVGACISVAAAADAAAAVDAIAWHAYVGLMCVCMAK